MSGRRIPKKQGVVPRPIPPPTPTESYSLIQFSESNDYPYPLSKKSSNPISVGRLQKSQRQLAHQVFLDARARNGIVYSGDNVELKWSDVRTLEYHEWLSDQVINAAYDQYHLLLPKSSFYYFDTDFINLISNNKKSFNVAAAERYRLKQGLPLDRSFLFIPVHRDEDHWALIVVHGNQILYHDSLGRRGDWKKWLMWIARFLNLRNKEEKVYHARIAPGQKRQTNAVDCGVWVAYTGATILKKKDYREIVPDEVSAYRSYLQWLIGHHPKVYVKATSAKRVKKEIVMPPKKKSILPGVVAPPTVMPQPFIRPRRNAKSNPTVSVPEEVQELPEPPRKKGYIPQASHGDHYRFILTNDFVGFVKRFLELKQHKSKYMTQSLYNFLHQQFKAPKYFSAATKRWRKYVPKQKHTKMYS